MASKNTGVLENIDELYTDKNAVLTVFERNLLLSKRDSGLRAEYRRRIEIMLLCDMGYSQSQICAALGCAQETARHWISMARSGKACSWAETPVGRPKTIPAEYEERLRELIEKGPKFYGYAFRVWTAGWLSRHLAKEFNIEVSDRHINRLLRKMGLSTRNKKDQSQAIKPFTPNPSNIVIRNLKSTSSQIAAKPSLMAQYFPFTRKSLG